MTTTPAGTAPAIVHSPDPDADKRQYAFLLDDGQFLLPSGCDTLLVEFNAR